MDTSVERKLIFKRSEIIKKFNINNEEISNEELNVIVKKIEDKNKEINSKGTIKKIVRKATLDDKRSEIVGKFNLENKFDKELGNTEYEEEANDKLNVQNDFNEDIEKYFSFKRSEIIKKFNIDNEVKGKITKEELELIVRVIEEKNKKINEISPIKVEVSPSKLEDRRSEIVGKFEVKDDLEIKEDIKRVSETRIEELTEESEELEDKVQENVENISIAMIIIIVLVCSIVGTIIGYMLYKIAMGNSVAMVLIFKNFIFSLHI